jgi:hypothetical protein
VVKDFRAALKPALAVEFSQTQAREEVPAHASLPKTSKLMEGS